MLQLGPIPEALVEKYVGLAATAAEFLVVVAVLYFLGRFVVRPVIRWLLRRSPLNRTLVQSGIKFVELLVVLVALGVGAGVAGIPIAGSATIVAAGTLAVGFAAQDVLSNLVAGIFLVQDPKLNVGDQIEWESHTGTIGEIGFRVTRVRTAENDTPIVPNTELATNAITNHTVNDPIGITYDFGIGYGDDVGEAIEVISSVAGDHAAILERRQPTVRVRELEDASVVLRARVWIAREDRNRRAEVRAAFVRGVHERCRAAGIDLSTTTQHGLTGSVALEDDDGSERTPESA